MKILTDGTDAKSSKLNTGFPPADRIRERLLGVLARPENPGIFPFRLPLMGLAMMAGLVASVYAHPDPGSSPALKDWLVLKELYAESDQDDGINGRSEYIVRLTGTHDGHAHANFEIVLAFSVNWDDTDPDTGKPYDEAVPLRMPLVGKNGAISSGLNLFKDGQGICRECSPSAGWEVTLQLQESDSLELADILQAIGRALERAGTNLPAALDPRIAAGIFVGGPLASEIGKVLNDLFKKTDELDHETPIWIDGEGDGSTNAVTRSGDALHASFLMEKHVVTFSGKAPECEEAVTNAPAETPDHAFGDDVQRALASWDFLRSGALQIDGMSIESGTTNGPVQRANLQGQRQALRELVAVIGRAVALTELEEAAQHPDLVPPPQLDPRFRS